MKRKLFLTIIGLVCSQTILNSCNSDTVDTQSNFTDNALANAAIRSSSTTANSLVSANGSYFADAAKVRNIINFVNSHLSSQGSDYTFTQDDLEILYNEAQIPPDERLSFDAVNEILTQTLSSLQLPLDQIVNQMTVSDTTKSLILTIHNNGSIQNLNSNISFQTLTEKEKMLIINLNDYKKMWESQGTVSKISNAELYGTVGGLIGFGVGLCCPPAGPFVGLFAGAIIGIAIGSSK